METLAIKYRPKTFDDVVEQSNIVAILREQLETGTQKNGYLFTGGAGTGKTTTARIFASELNKGKGAPVEIDAASNNGVENVREIIDNAKFKSLDSEYKVYIIDECHMLSTGAWNAMLKLLEEPPAKTIFLLCTTDPQKIPATILSRVQRYDFQRITFDGVVERLNYICEQEGFSLYDEDGGVKYIAKIADGGMRDAITLLDKCASYNTEITLKNVIDALGTVNYDEYFWLTSCIFDADIKGIIVTIEEAHRRGVDLKQFVKQYLSFMLDVCKYAVLRNFEYLQIPELFAEQLEDCGVKWCLDDWHLYLLDQLTKLSSGVKWEMSPKPYIQSWLIGVAIKGRSGDE